jgi:hypothetical protein
MRSRSEVLRVIALALVALALRAEPGARDRARVLYVDEHGQVSPWSAAVEVR